MPQRLKFIVAYDGAAFAGWQSQLHRKTAQDELERAFNKITGAHVRIHGAGRTDAGVHALAQCAHVDLPDRRLSITRWRSALNGVLPPTIRVLRCRYVASDFHARFSAKGKTYLYRIWTGPILPPLEFKRAWHIPVRLDVAVMKVTGKNFVGRHDFTGFAANRGKKEENTIRTIRSVEIGRRGFNIKIEITGDGFLYKMARLMVGAMVRVALDKMEPAEIGVRLKSPRHADGRFTAPAEGLYLARVWY